MLVVVLVPPSLSSGAPVGLAQAPLDVERDTDTIGDGASRFCKKKSCRESKAESIATEIKYPIRIESSPTAMIKGLVNLMGKGSAFNNVNSLRYHCRT